MNALHQALLRNTSVLGRYGFAGEHRTHSPDGEREDISAELVDHPAAQRRIEHSWVRGWIEMDCKGRVDELRVADRSLLEQLPVPDDRWKETRPHGFHKKQSFAPSAKDQVLCLKPRQGQWLFANHVLARLQAEQRILEMRRMRRGDVNDVDVVGSHQCLIAFVPSPRAEGARFLAPSGRPGGDGLQRAALGRPDRRSHVPRGVSGAKTPPAARMLIHTRARASYNLRARR